MSTSSSIEKEAFWETVKFLLELDQKTSFSEICEQLDLSEKHLNTYLNFLRSVDFEFEIEQWQGSKYLRPIPQDKSINVKFSLFEWLQFQAHFPHLEIAKNFPYHNEFKTKLACLENTYSKHDLFEPLKALDEILEEHKPALVTSNEISMIDKIHYIEESILEKQTLVLNLENNSISFFPQSLIYLEGQLSAIGENVTDKSLINIPISTIQSLSDEDIEWNPSYSKIEIHDFIASIRAINDQETRLVLKINGLTNFENSIPRNFLGNPAMVTNSEGDLIWGATVESNIEIFNWLRDLGSDVEILDPISFKKEYLAYCEELLKKLA